MKYAVVLGWLVYASNFLALDVIILRLVFWILVFFTVVEVFCVCIDYAKQRTICEAEKIANDIEKSKSK